MKAKTKFTRLWSILLVLVMVVGMLPTVALAAGAATEKADFSANPTAALALLNAAKTADAEDSTWDSTTKTLTLNGVNFETTAAIAVILPDDAKIVLNGDNIITSGEATSEDSFGIYALGDLTINGDGKLDVTGGTATGNSHGIYATNGLSISGTATVTAMGGAAGYYSYGIGSDTTIDISGGTVYAEGGGTSSANSFGLCGIVVTISGADVTAIGGTAAKSSSYGLLSVGNVTISGTAKVKATGGTAKDDSCGICAYNNVSIEDGIVTATGGTAGSGYDSCGIYATNGLSISGTAKVEATGGEATNGNSYGIYSNRDAKISGGTTRVTATGGTVNATGGTAGSGYDSCGICANDNVIIEDGIVSAKGGKATDDSYGICAYKNVTIKSGTVNATGGAAQMTEYSMSGGIQGSYYIAIEGGIVEATGGAAWISCGFSIVALGRMDIKGGTVTATGGTSTEKGSYGIYTDYSAYVKITGGSLIAKAGSAPSAKALPWAPDTLPAIYWWRSSDSGQYKKGDFNWGDVSTYVEIGDTEPITTYTVTFDANGGTGTMAGVSGVLGDYTLPANGFTAPEGKQFKCWSVDGKEKAVGDKITVSADTTVKAVWEDIEYTVTVTNGTASVSKAAAGATVTLTANRAPSGQVFDKWVAESGNVTLADATSATTTFTMPAGNVTAKATYKNIPVVTHTVTFEANGGSGSMAAVTGVLGTYTLPENGFTAPEGKQFKCWSVNGTEKAARDQITVTANITVTAVWENIPAAPTEYNILDGANSKWTQDSDGNLSVRGSGAFSEFVGVKVDGKLVDEKYYTVKEGSTIVTLKADYLNTLTVGSHTLEIIWTDGSASTAFTVSAQTVVESPQTGDNNSIALWIALLFVSGFGVVATAVYGKKRKSVK